MDPSPEYSHRPAGLRRLLLTAALVLSLMSYALGLTVFGPVVAPLSAALSVSEAAAGALAAWMSAGFLGATFLCGPWAERAGLRPPAIAGAGFLALGFFAISGAQGYAGAAAGMVFYGMGGGFCEVAANATTADLYPRHRVSALNLLHVFFGVAALVGPRLSAFLVEGEAGWRHVYLLAGLFALAPLPLYFALRFPGHASPRDSQVGGPPARRERSLWRIPVVWVLVAAVLLYVGAEISLNNWGVLFLQRSRGWPAADAAGAVSDFWIAMTAGRIVVSFVGRRRSPERVLLFLCLGATACGSWFVFGAGGARLGGSLAIVAAGAFFSGIFATLYAIGAERFAHRSAAITAALTLAAGSGILVLAPGVGFLAEGVGIGRAMTLVPLYLLFLLGCAAWLFRSRPAPTAKPIA